LRFLIGRLNWAMGLSQVYKYQIKKQCYILIQSTSSWRFDWYTRKI